MEKSHAIAHAATVAAPSGRRPPPPPRRDAGTMVGIGPAAAVAAPSSIEHAETLAAPASLPVSGASVRNTTLSRTTVLPRVQPDGGAAALVYEEAPRYQALGALGEGGVGEVVKVKDNDIGRVVAMKRLRAEMRNDAAPLARFVDEIRTIGQLEHPNIVPIHDVGVDEEGQHYFVMKYVRGETLESIIKKLADGDADYHRRYGFEARIQIFRGILEAVAFAHDKGFIHRDIKPANVMVGPFGEVMVMDWGIAKRIPKGGEPAPCEPASTTPVNENATGNTLQTQVGCLVGTPAYMSPEQARGEQDLDVRSDVYSLSMLLYELLTLHHPLADKQTLASILAAVAHEQVPMATFDPHANKKQGAVPVDLSWYVRKGLAKDREERYESVQAMIERLDRRAEGYVPIQCHCTAAKRAATAMSRFVSSHPMITSILMVAMLAMMIASVVFAIAK